MVLTHKKSSKIKDFKGLISWSYIKLSIKEDRAPKLLWISHVLQVNYIGNSITDVVHFPVRLFRRLNGAFSQNMQIYFLLVFAQLSGS